MTDLSGVVPPRRCQPPHTAQWWLWGPAYSREGELFPMCYRQQCRQTGHRVKVQTTVGVIHGNRQPKPACCKWSSKGAAVCAIGGVSSC